MENQKRAAQLEKEALAEEMRKKMEENERLSLVEGEGCQVCTLARGSDGAPYVNFRSGAFGIPLKLYVMFPRITVFRSLLPQIRI